MSEILNLTVVFEEHESARVERIADNTSDPENPDYGKHLKRSELRDLVVLAPEERRAVRDWLTHQGMKIVDSPDTSPQLMFVQATEAQATKAFGESLQYWLEKSENTRGARLRLSVPRSLAGYIQKVGGLPGEVGQFGRTYNPEPTIERGTAGNPTADLKAEGLPPDLAGMTPADLCEIYNFPKEWDGSGETIALMEMGGRLDEADLHNFWCAHGVAHPPEVHTVQVGPSRDRSISPFETLEAMMSVEWVGALAPGARIVAYFVDPTIMGDPWSAFLFAVLGDEKYSPTVASVSWVTPERKYYRLHGRNVIEGLLDQAAGLGITVVAASGDWGSFDGVPRVVRDGRYVSDAPWPHGVFPAVEERVLGVGGTMITTRNPLTEIGWSGPLPPVGQILPLELVASSGGFSEDVPIPLWQRDALHASYPRGASTPAVVPYGRGIPDVALMAAGPSVQRKPGDALSMEGYQALFNGQWVDYAGGTSLAAPIWAGIIARANQARRAAGLSRLGFANPLFYRLSEGDPSPFRQITVGAADVAMYAVNMHGQAAIYRLPGYECCPGWNPVTGLGVPDVAMLIRQVCEMKLRPREP